MGNIFLRRRIPVTDEAAALPPLEDEITSEQEETIMAQEAISYIEQQLERGDAKRKPQDEIEAVFAEVRNDTDVLIQAALRRITGIVQTPSALEDGLRDVSTKLNTISEGFNGQHRSISELFEALTDAIGYCQGTVERLLSEVAGSHSGSADASFAGAVSGDDDTVSLN